MQHQIVKSQIQVGWESPEGDLFRALIKDADSIAVRFLANLWEISESTPESLIARNRTGVLGINARNALNAGVGAERLVQLAKMLEYVVNSVDRLIKQEDSKDYIPSLSDKFKKLTYIQFKVIALSFLVAISYDDVPRIQKKLKEASHEGFKAEIATFAFNDSQSGSEAEVKESILKTLDKMTEFLSEQLL